MLYVQLRKGKQLFYPSISKLFGMLFWLQESENGRPCARVMKPGNQGTDAHFTSHCSTTYMQAYAWYYVVFILLTPKSRACNNWLI